MNYLVRERIFTLADKFNITDGFGRNKFSVEAKLFSIGKKLRLVDSETLYTLNIEQKLFKVLEEYHILHSRETIGIVKKNLSFFRPNYSIKSIFGNYTIKGDVFAYDFSILKDDKLVGQVSKNFISLSDSYKVKVDEDENQAFILALVIILDQIHHSDYSSGDTNL